MDASVSPFDLVWHEKCFLFFAMQIFRNRERLFSEKDGLWAAAHDSVFSLTRRYFGGIFSGIISK